MAKTYRLSQYGTTFLKQEEGCKLKAYPDGGKYSVCFGHWGVPAGTTKTQSECDSLFIADVARFENAVNNLSLDIKQHQFDALVSLAYNIGETGIKNSNVVKLARVNANDPAINSAFLRHNTTMGLPSPVLTARRFREAQMYFNTETRNTIFIGIGIVAIGAGLLTYFLTREL
jgi:lysozyme